MSRRKPIGLKDRQRVLELASHGLSIPQIAERMNISYQTAQQTLAQGFNRCGLCARIISTGCVCPVCALSTNARFGERLRAFRSAARISQMRLAFMIGVSSPRIWHWEDGQTQPGAHEREMLAEALGLTVPELSGIAHHPQSNLAEHNGHAGVG